MVKTHKYFQEKPKAGPGMTGSSLKVVAKNRDDNLMSRVYNMGVQATMGHLNLALTLSLDCV